MEFIDLVAQRRRLQKSIDGRIARVLAHGQYIMGPEVPELEQELSRYTGARHVIGCANGTDALVLALRAAGIGTGDHVIVPSFTFCATAEAVCLAGAIPFFVDVLDTSFNLDPVSLTNGIVEARRNGLRLKAVIAVDLFGQPCDYDRIAPVAQEEGLVLICDAAQALGARYRDRSVGTIGDVTTTSFFPAKPLGCYGDGGAIFTDDDETASILRSLRVHGQGSDKYDNVRIGTNSRLDTLQAAILLEKLNIFPDEIAERNRVAARYHAELRGVLAVPEVVEGAISVWAQYTLRTPERDRIMSTLKRAGIPSAIYYRTSLHRQTAYRKFPRLEAGLPVSERLEHEVLSLPMHPYLGKEDQHRVTVELRRAVTGRPGPSEQGAATFAGPSGPA